MLCSFDVYMPTKDTPIYPFWREQNDVREMGSVKGRISTDSTWNGPIRN